MEYSSHEDRMKLLGSSADRQGVALSDEEAFSQLCDKCNLTDTEEHQIAHMFWQAALSRASSRVEAVPVAWATVLPSGALHAMRTKRPDAERRTAAWNASHPRPPLATTEPLVRASSSRAEVEIPAALEVVEAWGYDEGGQWDQGYAEGWNACRDAMLAAAEAPKGRDGK